jgi:hypothetical protein
MGAERVLHDRPADQRSIGWRIANIQRSDGWIEITWNNMSGIDCIDLLVFAGLLLS